MANQKNLPGEVNNAWTLPGAETWWSSIAEYQGEMFDFLSHRFSKDSVALHGLGECRAIGTMSRTFTPSGSRLCQRTPRTGDLAIERA